MDTFKGLWATRWKMRALGFQVTEGKGGTRGVKKISVSQK